MIKSYKDLDVFKLSYDYAMDVFKLTKQFPGEEKYSLTSQIVRSSRSISANIAEGWAKRIHENVFKNHLISALGSSTETEVWINFAKDCEYISEAINEQNIERINAIGKMLNKLHNNWTTFESNL